MRKVVMDGLLSLDGVAEDPNRFFTEWDEVVDAGIPRLIATQDAVILGRRSYDEWVGFWPGSEIEPFATFINGVAKHVATSAPLQPQWTNAHVIDGNLVEFARRLKDGPGGDIGVHGSISVAQALLAGGIVDELRLVIAPSIAGGGRPTPRRLAIDSTRIDPQRDLTDWLSARRLSRYSLRRWMATRPRDGQARVACSRRPPVRTQSCRMPDREHLVADASRTTQERFCHGEPGSMKLRPAAL